MFLFTIFNPFLKSSSARLSLVNDWQANIIIVCCPCKTFVRNARNLLWVGKSWDKVVLLFALRHLM